MDDDNDFWKRSTASEGLELRRREEREALAAGWRRNIVAFVLLALLIWAVWYMWRP